jgi:serine protease inhibitor ecotin
MTQALHITFIDPEQAKKAIMGQIAPYCKAQWAQGVERLSVTVQPQEDDLSDRQRRYYHGVILTQIAEQARCNAHSFPMKVWKEHFREVYVGYKWVALIDPMTGKKKRRKVRVSSEDFGVRRYSKLIEQVTAFAVTDLGVRFTIQFEDFR